MMEIKQLEFREYRKDYFESLETVVLVGSLIEIEHLVNQIFKPLNQSVQNIKLEWAENEHVKGWDSYAVKVKLIEDKKYIIAGYTNGKF